MFMKYILILFPPLQPQLLSDPPHLLTHSISCSLSLSLSLFLSNTNQETKMKKYSKKQNKIIKNWQKNNKNTKKAKENKRFTKMPESLFCVVSIPSDTSFEKTDFAFDRGCHFPKAISLVVGGTLCVITVFPYLCGGTLSDMNLCKSWCAAIVSFMNTLVPMCLKDTVALESSIPSGYYNLLAFSFT